MKKINVNVGDLVTVKFDGGVVDGTIDVKDTYTATVTMVTDVEDEELTVAAKIPYKDILEVIAE